MIQRFIRSILFWSRPRRRPDAAVIRFLPYQKF